MAAAYFKKLMSLFIILKYKPFLLRKLEKDALTKK